MSITAEMTGYLQGTHMQMHQLTERCEVLIISYNYVYPQNLTYLQQQTGIPVTYVGTNCNFTSVALLVILKKYKPK
jgi:hypothetical protein